MLCPEVWNFSPPEPSFSYKIYESENDMFGAVKNQFFYHNVSLILPNTLQSPTQIVDTLLQDSQYYKISDVPAGELLNKEFINLFIENGHLSAVSITKDLEPDDCLTFTPDRKLILVLSRKTYQELGISNVFVKSFRHKHILVLDLSSDCDKQRKKFDDYQSKLLSCKNLCFDIILSWEPDVPEVCPSSIASYFFKKGYDVVSCDIQFKKRLHYNIAVPVIDDECDLMEFIEWIGAFSLQCDVPEHSYISTMKYTGTCEDFGQVMFLNFTGLFPVSRILKTISKINEYVKAKSPESWMSLVVQGFEKGVIGTKNQQLFQSSGDHHHAIIFKKDGTFLIFSFGDVERPDA